MQFGKASITKKAAAQSGLSAAESSASLAVVCSSSILPSSTFLNELLALGKSVMPESLLVGETTGASRCARCRAPDPTCVVRTEQLCVSCFSKYISMKVIKRLEANKIRAGYNEASKKILIPVSAGVSSLYLLQILDEHVRKRTEQGRHEGYSISLIFIDEECVIDSSPNKSAHLTAFLEAHFNSYVLHRVALEDSFDHGINVDQLIAQRSSDTAERSLENLDRLKFVLQATRSPSSRSDVLDVLRRSLIEAFAQQRGFDYILYGDSSTRLAERTLAETAKGRGFAVPSTHSDQTERPGVSCVYPLRDLLRKELVMYAETLAPHFSSFTRTTKALVTSSLKDTSIDDLMRQYVESVEVNYPSVVANVVRTTAKLHQPGTEIPHSTCALCKAPYLGEEQEGLELSRSLTGQGPRSTEMSVAICHGCERTLDSPV